MRLTAGVEGAWMVVVGVIVGLLMVAAIAELSRRRRVGIQLDRSLREMAELSDIRVIDNGERAANVAVRPAHREHAAIERRPAS